MARSAVRKTASVTPVNSNNGSVITKTALKQIKKENVDPNTMELEDTDSDATSSPGDDSYHSNKPLQNL